jgi:hypothetical protein
MAKNLQIQLEFTTKGAEELINSLKILAKQQRSVARSQREFNNANLKAVTATKKLLMAQEKHRFAMLKNSTQVAKLKEQVRQLRMRNKQLELQLGKTTRASNRMRIATAGLQRFIGSIRNKILLVTFAFGGMAAGIRSAVQTSMQFEAVQVRLNSMFGSVQRGEQAFRTFNQVAATTPFTLTDVVEAGAALKAFGTNAEEMIKPTADLAAFMGVTATEAAQALGRAFAGGAGAADILRERGILQLIRDTKGIEDLSKVSLPEFRKALEETLLDPSVGIAGATDRLSKTLTGMVSNMADAFTRMKAAIGEFINMKGIVETLTGAFEKLGERIRQANETPFETSIRHLQEMGVETAKLELTQAKLLKTRMEENGATGNLVKAEGDLEALMEMREESAIKLAKERQKLIEAGMSEETILKRLEGIETARAVNDRMSRKQKEALNEEEADLLDKLQRSKDLQEELAQRNLRVKELMEALGLETEYAAQLAKILGLEEQISEKKKEQTSETEKLVALTKEQQTLMLEGEKMALQLKEEMLSAHFDKVLSLANKNIESRKQAELQALRDTDAFRNASQEERQDMEKDALKKFKDQQRIIFRLQQASEIAQVIANSTKTIAEIMQLQIKMTALAAALAVTNPIQAARAGKAAAALSGMIGVSKASAAAQIGLIAGQKPPAFARGGSFITGGQQMIMVGDNAGGRERVDITPLSSPDFGDAGGGGSINVNIMGNVIGTQEFVRDSLLPEIENTIKRNLA